MTTVKINELPLDIQSQIPMSVRSFKNEYDLTELPFDISFLIEEYLTRKESIDYDFLLDITPDISQYGDFTVIDNVHDLVIEYLKNYFLISPFDYPFDPIFGSRLKYQIQKLDTAVRQKIISNEISNITSTLTQDIGIPIKVSNLDISKSSSSGLDVEMVISLKISINNIEKQFVLNI